MAARSRALCRPHERAISSIFLPPSMGWVVYTHTHTTTHRPRRAAMPLGAYVTPKTNTTKQGDAITHLAALFTLTQWIHSVKSCSRLDYDSYRPQITTVYVKKRAHACMALHPMAQVSACVRASNLVCACIWSMHVCAWYMAVRASTPNSMDPTRWHSPTEHGNPATDHRRQADGGTRGGPQGTRPHCRRHLATHPRGGPPGRGGTCSGPPLPGSFHFSSSTPLFRRWP